MDFQKVLGRVLAGALAVAFIAIAVSADIYSAPLRGGELCTRCDRVLENPAVAGEILSVSKTDASPFRTISCMMTYLRDKNVAADRIYVADFTTGRLTPVEQLHFVRVPVQVLSRKATYGVGAFDYVAFRSSMTAAKYAERYETEPIDWAGLRDAHEAAPTFAMAAHMSH